MLAFSGSRYFDHYTRCLGLSLLLPRPLDTHSPLWPCALTVFAACAHCCGCSHSLLRLLALADLVARLHYLDRTRSLLCCSYSVLRLLTLAALLLAFAASAFLTHCFAGRTHFLTGRTRCFACSYSLIWSLALATWDVRTRGSANSQSLFGMLALVALRLALIARILDLVLCCSHPLLGILALALVAARTRCFSC